MSPAGVRICVILGIITAIGLANADKIDPIIPCSNTSDCRRLPGLPGDAFCTGGVCMCPRVESGIEKCSSINVSMHEAKNSGPLVFRICKHQKDCNFTGGTCNNTNWQCNCMKNYVPSSNNQHCVEKINSIEAPCIDKNQCAIFLTNSTCIDNKCICEPGYHQVDNSCWKTAKYNESCTKNQECLHIENSTCTENMICDCAAETVLSANGEKCLPAAKKIQDECVESIQCTTTFESSACIDKKCQCEENFHYEYELTRCFRNKAIGEECANSYECYQAKDYESDPPIKSVMCVSNKCTCANNYILIDTCVNAGLKLFSSLTLVALMIALAFFS